MVEGKTASYSDLSWNACKFLDYMLNFSAVQRRMRFFFPLYCISLSSVPHLQNAIIAPPSWEGSRILPPGAEVLSTVEGTPQSLNKCHLWLCYVHTDLNWLMCSRMWWVWVCVCGGVPMIYLCAGCEYCGMCMYMNVWHSNVPFLTPPDSVFSKVH